MCIRDSHNGQDHFTLAINEDSLHQTVASKSEQQTHPQTNNNNNNDNDQQLKVTLQPNPSSGLFTLIITQKTDTPLQIRITDANGKEVKKYNKTDATRYTELTDTINHEGIYLIQVTNQDEKKTTKLIIVK
jgi:hypothetical protein